MRRVRGKDWTEVATYVANGKLWTSIFLLHLKPLADTWPIARLRDCDG